MIDMRINPPAHQRDEKQLCFAPGRPLDIIDKSGRAGVSDEAVASLFAERATGDYRG